MHSNTSLLEWSRLTQLHELIPAPSSVKCTTVAAGYLLRIQNTEGISTQQQIGFSLTFYHSVTGQFFGRTYFLSEDQSVCYLSQIQDETVIGICEILLIDRHTGAAESYGWSKLIPFICSEPRSAPIYKGTPRGLSPTVSEHSIPGVSLYYEVRDYSELTKIQRILPLNAAVGGKDQLPGIKGDFVPMDERESIDFSPDSTVYISQIEIFPADSLENRLLEFASEWQIENYGTHTQERPRIIDRLLSVGLHNT